MTGRIHLATFGMASLLVITHTSSAETAPLGGEITWATVRTSLEKQAVGYAVDIAPKLSEGVFFGNAGGMGYVGPEFAIETGDDDTFDSFNAKVGGFYGFSPPMDEDDEPDYNGVVHIVPFAVGIETDRNFVDAAGIVEVGWTPIGPVVTKGERFGLSEQRYAGIYLQVGYKTASSSTNAVAEASSGRENESEEDAEDGLTRIKVEAAYGFDIAERLYITPKGVVWFDLVNSEVYYQASASVRLVLVEDQYALEGKFEKGSGAPNFNEGEQFSAGLVVSF